MRKKIHKKTHKLKWGFCICVFGLIKLCEHRVEQDRTLSRGKSLRLPQILEEEDKAFTFNKNIILIT
jgi:hypothetical protein